MGDPETVRRSEQSRRRIDGYLPIEDYAAIGDGRTLALIGGDGSIDWMCLPDLDAPSAFGALLDPVKGGSFSLAPAIPHEARRWYLERTNVLRTEYVTAAGTVGVTEGVTLDTAQNSPRRELVRAVEGLAGTVPMEWRLRPRFGYGRHAREPERTGDAVLYRHEDLQVVFRAWAAGEPRLRRDSVEGAFEVSQGEQALLALVASDEIAVPIPERAEVERRLGETERLWRDWVSRCSYEGPWRDAVERSLLALRLLADGRSGAIAAAGTTSLPEAIGAQRNYDYRFGWVRDLSFTVNALLRVGMEELAHQSIAWLLDALGDTAPRIDPVYELAGGVVRGQVELPLAGYRGTPPVHLGNDAGSQLQLGGFGDLMETMWQYVDHGHVLRPDTGERIADCADLLCAIWRRRDAGLWELDDYAQYTTSKIGCWTALDRLLGLVEIGQAPARHLRRWRAERDRIRSFIEAELYSDSRGSYVMKAGSEELDCGTLLASRRGYADPEGERMRGTIEAIRSELAAGGPLLYRYSGMQQEESAFLACSFWMIEALTLAGRSDEAAEAMDTMVSLGTAQGLYSEEIEPESKSLRGNFPQALTHLALVSAAALLAERERSA